MIPIENKNMTLFKQRLLPNCLPHDREIVTVNRGESTSQYHTPLAVVKFTGKRKKNKFRYFIATQRIVMKYGSQFICQFVTTTDHKNKLKNVNPWQCRGK
jgi:hypothetical protein